MVKTVFLDVDGVLANFQKAVCKQFGLHYPPQEYDFFEPIRSIVDAFCTIDFWTNLEWMPDGQDILWTIENRFGLDHIYLLTTPMHNPESATGKWLWIKKNLPFYYHRTIIISVPKSLFAKPDTLLIDDKDQNVNEFINVGGNAILVPRFWNSLSGYADNSLQIIGESLRNF